MPIDDTEHCGACDAPCRGRGAETAVCLATDGGARCVRCASGQTLCGDACVDLATDDAHCGSCRHGCRGQGCGAGRCLPKTLATRQGHITAVATAGDGSVYWTTYGAGTTPYLAVHGGGDPPCDGVGDSCAVPIVVEGAGVMDAGTNSRLAATSRFVYVGVADGLLRRPRVGASFDYMTAVSGGIDRRVPTSPVRSDDDRAVWGSEGASYVLSAPEGGAARTIMYDGDAEDAPPSLPLPRAIDVAFDGSDVFALVSGPNGIRLDRGDVRQVCQRPPTRPFCVTLLLGGSGRYLRLAVGGAWIYLLETARDGRAEAAPGANRILRLGRDSHCSNPATCLADGVVVADVPSPGPLLTADANFLYWMKEGAIVRTPLGEKPCPETDCVLGAGLSRAVSTAVDATSLYVGLTDPSGAEGTVLRFVK